MKSTTKEDCLISIIVPAYNIGKNILSRCINSIVNQTYKNIEIVIVDDGSVDDTRECADFFEKKDKRIIAIHQANKGLGGARNTGVCASHGKYVTFVDSDDVIAQNMIEVLYYSLIKTKSDISIIGMKTLYAVCEIESSNDFETKCFGTEETLSKMAYGIDIGVSACAKLFPKHLCIQHPFLEKTYYEDLEVTYKIIADCSKIAFSNVGGYGYIRRPGSITNGEYTKKHDVLILYAESMRAFYAEHFPLIEKAAIYRIGRGCLEVLRMKGIDRKTFLAYQTVIKKYYKCILQDDLANKMVKIKSIIALLGYYPTKIMFVIQNIIQNIVISLFKC